MVDSDNENEANNSSEANTRRRRNNSFHRDADDVFNSGPTMGMGYSRGGRDHWRGRKPHFGYGGGGSHGSSYYNRNNRKYSPSRYRDHSPMQYPKRIRRDWDALENNPAFGLPMNNTSQYDVQGLYDDSTPPGYSAQILGFKAFLCDQEDTIDELEALRRYSKYKLDFRKNQISDFFLNHKHEEWFRIKYDSLMARARKRKERETILIRLETCMEMMERDLFDDISLDLTESDKLIDLLDKVVIKCEQLEMEHSIAHQTPSTFQEPREPAVTNADLATGLDEPFKSIEKDDLYCSQDEDMRMNDFNDTDNCRKELSVETHVDSSTSGSDALNHPSEKNDNEGDHVNRDSSPLEKVLDEPSSESANKKANNHDDEPTARTLSIFLRSLPSSVTRNDVVQMCRKFNGFKRVALSDPLPERRFQRRGWLTFSPCVDVKKICWEINSQKHWSCDVGAIVNRELTRRIRPIDSITNYAAVALNDLKMAVLVAKTMDARWMLWTKCNAAEFDAHVAQEFYKPDELFSDPKYADSSSAQLFKETTGGDQALDESQSSGSDSLSKVEQLRWFELQNSLTSTMSKNPFVAKAEDVLAIAGDSLLIKNLEANDSIAIASCQVKQALDQLILYLRIVHSIDFYNAVEYQLEDRMPNRCGILHVRSSFGIHNYCSLDKQSTTDMDVESPAADNDELKQPDSSTVERTSSPTSIPSTFHSETAADDTTNDYDLLLTDITLGDEHKNITEEKKDLSTELNHTDGICTANESTNVENVKSVTTAAPPSVLIKPPDSTKSTETSTAPAHEIIRQWVTKFNQRLEPFTRVHPVRLSIDEAVKLGLKSEQIEVEKFINQNVVRINEDKWTCPLSGKKFRGPEFVRKHLYNKHQDKIANVRQEVQCFNNFVIDPKRPCLPEQFIYRPLLFNTPNRHNTFGNDNYSSSGTGSGFRSNRTTPAQSSGNYKHSYHNTGSTWNSTSPGWHTHYGPNRMRGGRGNANHGSVDSRTEKKLISTQPNERETVKYDLNYAELDDEIMHK